MKLSRKKIVLLKVEDEEQTNELKEIITFCTQAKVNFDDDSVMYNIINDFQKFVSMVLSEQAFYSDGTVYDVDTHCNQPFKEED